MLDLDIHLPGITAADPEAFALWLSAAEGPLRRALRSFAVKVDVEAVLQEALLRTWQVAPRCRPDGKANALLRLSLRIAQNLAVSEARRLRPDVPDVPVEELDGAVDAVFPEPPDPLLRRRLAECREKLPGKPAQAFDARMTSAGESDVTLAERLGMRLNTFLQNFTRARQLILRCLEKNGVTLEGL